MLPPVTGIGQSSSVMLDQKTQMVTTAARLKSDENKPPFIAPFVPLQIYTEMTNWKIWLIAKSRAAAKR